MTANTGHKLEFATDNNTTAMTIDSSQNVGIGVASPSMKLNISHGDQDGLRFTAANTHETFIDFGDTDDNDAGSIRYDHNDNSLAFRVNASERARINSSGNVGIGVVSPSFKLSVVGGDIHTDGYVRADDGIITHSVEGSVVTLSNNGTYTMLSNPQGNVGLYIGDTGDGQNYYQSGAHRFRSYDGSTYQGTFNNTGLKIGTGYASYKLDVAGDARITSGSLGVGVTPNATDGRGDFSNDVVAYSTSDKRLKENIKPLDNALGKVLKISGVEFDWKELTEEEKKTIHGNEGHDIGVIAQEIEEVLPEVVTTRDNGYKAVKYEKIVPLLIEAIKEQQEQINKLEEKLNG
jgi:hypothetical protein